MGRILIAVILLIALNLINIISQIIRRKVMLDFTTLNLQNFLSTKLWVSLFTNWAVLLVLFFSFLLFIINLAVFSFTGVNNVTIISFGLIIPCFLITILLSNIYLGETITKGQHIYIGIFILAMILSFFAILGFIKNQ